MSVLRRPLVDDQSDPVLNRECPAEMQQIQSAIGTSGDFDGKVVRDDRIAQYGSCSHNLYNGPGQDRWQWHAHNQGELGQHEQYAKHCQQSFSRNAAFAQTIRERSQQQCA